MPVYTYTTFDDPLNTSGDGTLASGINDTGQIVGTYADASGVHGFLLSGGSYTTLDDPLAAHRTLALGIDDKGRIVGSYDNASGRHGFLYNPSGGSYTTLDDPLATDGTEAFGINGNGQIVGRYFDASGTHGFLYSGGIYITLDDPLATKVPMQLGSTIQARSSGITPTLLAPMVSLKSPCRTRRRPPPPPPI